MISVSISVLRWACTAQADDRSHRVTSWSVLEVSVGVIAGVVRDNSHNDALFFYGRLPHPQGTLPGI